MYSKKSRIRETKNLSTDVNSRTDTIWKGCGGDVGGGGRKVGGSDHVT